MFAIIGGSGLSKLSSLDEERREVVRTPYGEPSGPLLFGQVGGKQVVFLARHGYGHSIPPHAVNYRANIWALKQAGAEGIVSVASVGGIRADLGPGMLAVPSQVLDYTWGRKATYFDGSDSKVVHIDFTEPYDAALRTRILRAAQAAGQPVLDGGVYATTQGPRLESAAEINRLERDGADMVGMTGMPEAALARELDIPYAAIAVVANHAAGRASSAGGIAMSDIEATLQEAMVRVRLVLEQLCALPE
ncbi:S-methyl-5'-thioinosine phosphorylase [Viridibacterium curvum]|uniref:Probable S-methyl-5'-thioinosine phosphorylase n=1 Tax=Viridibacterium curvum TaxID=1101404 RepID=A0ABP9R2M8_9RHOO